LIDLPTALIEYIDLVLHSKAGFKTDSFFGMVQATYTTFTRMISYLLILVLDFASYLCNNYDIILVLWCKYDVYYDDLSMVELLLK